MKKIFILAMLCVFTSSIFALEAKVVSVNGKVQVQRGNAWTDLKAGDVIKKGELIQTGFKSEAEISLVSPNQNSKLTVTQLSRLTFEQLAENIAADKASVFLETGSVKSEIKKTVDRRASYTVRSPVATASVRGTVITVTTGFDTASLVTEEGIAAFYETSASQAAPIISTSEEDNAFAELTNEQIMAGDLYPAVDVRSVDVAKGQQTASDGNSVKTAQQVASESVQLTAMQTTSPTEVAPSSSIPSVELSTAPTTGSLQISIGFAD